MCGRYVRSTPPEVFAQLYRAQLNNLRLTASYNIHPGQDVLACRTRADGDREMVLFHWGLVPSWAKDPKIGYKMNNARAETIADKPAFRSAFRQRRCVIAADGFYEWKTVSADKQPYFFRLADGGPMSFAGLWEEWMRGEQRIESCSIVVTQANACVAAVHDRMPVILPPKHIDTWLDPNEHDAQRLQALLVPFAAAAMAAHPVSPRVNSPREQGADLIRQTVVVAPDLFDPPGGH